MQLARPDALFPSDSTLWTRVAGSIIIALLFFGSVLAHELAHSLVGRRYNVPVKSITLFIFGGMARITREASSPKAELLMAIAGPLCSVVLALVFLVIGLILWLNTDSMFIIALAWLGGINLMLAIFNMLPGFPLDGGRVLRATLWYKLDYIRASRIASLIGQGMAYLFIVVGIVWMFSSPFQGVWLAFIGWMLQNAAGNSYHQAEMQNVLVKYTAREVMIASYPLVSSSVTIQELVQKYMVPTGYSFLPVVDWSGLKGIVTLTDAKSVSKDRWEFTSVKEAMNTYAPIVTIDPEVSAIKALELMEEHSVDGVIVLSQGIILGVVERYSLYQFGKMHANSHKRPVSEQATL